MVKRRNDSTELKKAKQVKLADVEESDFESFSDSNSEQEIDDLDEVEEDVSAALSTPSGTASSTPGSGTNASSKQEQKRLQKERKLKKQYGAEIEQIKKLWELLREKRGVSKSDRTKYMREIMQLVDGKWKELVFRHDASRVVQTVFKYADKPLKYEITIALKGRYVDLAKSAYGKYLLVKMLHYGTPQVRSDIIDEMHGSFRKLMGHKEGAYVLEDLYRDYATSKQRKQIMREFYGSEFALFKDAGGDAQTLKDIINQNPEKKPFLMENLNKVITQAVSKGSIGFEIVHGMMLEYVKNLDYSPNNIDRETFVDLVADDIVEMVHTNAGSQVASLVLAMSTAKERKRLLKSLRQFPVKLGKDNYGFIVIMAAFLTVDDTKLCHKAFEELEENIVDIILDKYARRVLLMLLTSHENTKYFGVLQQRFRDIALYKQQFSKKDDSTRQQELLNFFLPKMNEAAVNNFNQLAVENLGIQFLQELVLSQEKSTNQPSIPDSVINAVVTGYSGNPLDSDHLLQKSPMANRVAKQFIRNSELLSNKFAELMLEYPLEWATSEGCFSVISLLETNKSKNAEKLKKKLAKNKSAIEKSKVKGSDLLISLL